MKKIIYISLIIFGNLQLLNAQLDPGDLAPGFSLVNTEGEMISLDDFTQQKGVVLVFTCNACPFSKAYEQRIIALHNRYAKAGYPVIAINPNDDQLSPDDDLSAMRERAIEKQYPFHYLKDDRQEVFINYGATRTPQVFLLIKEAKNFRVAFVGAIDDNAMDDKAVSERYVEQAIRSIETGSQPLHVKSRAIGCAIKSGRSE